MENKFQINANGFYHLNDFMHLHDKEFVHAAYLAVIRRAPDPTGTEYYINRIRRGVSRENILAQLMKSAEAKQFKTKIGGLPSYILLDKLLGIPVLGGLLSGLLYIFTVKSRLKDKRALENHLYRITDERPGNTERNHADKSKLDFELNHAHQLTPRAHEIYAQLKKLSTTNQERFS